MKYANPHFFRFAPHPFLKDFLAVENHFNNNEKPGRKTRKAKQATTNMSRFSFS